MKLNLDFLVGFFVAELCANLLGVEKNRAGALIYLALLAGMLLGARP